MLRLPVEHDGALDVLLQQIAIDVWENPAGIGGVLTLGCLPLDLGGNAFISDLEDQEVAELGTGEEAVGGAGDLGRGRQVVEAVGGVEGGKGEDAVRGVECTGRGDELVDKLGGDNWGE